MSESVTHEPGRPPTGPVSRFVYLERVGTAVERLAGAAGTQAS